MPFFDKKEDVLDIKLTPYGRHLLSKGQLMPMYYSFLDEDVVYDVKHINFWTGEGEDVEQTTDTQANVDIKTRIISETPSLKPMYTFNSLEAEIDETETFTVGDAEVLISAYDNAYLESFRPAGDVSTKFLQNTIGTSKQGNFNAPRWEINMLSSEIKSAVNHTSSIPNATGISSPSASVLHIPQVQCELVYNVQVKNTADDPTVNDSSNLDIKIYEDGTYLDVEEQMMLTEVLERNGFIHDESFEIQVYKFDDREAPFNEESTFNNTFRPLKFINKLIGKDYRVEKDIFIEDPTQTILEPDVNTVEYYFDLRVDEEIPVDDICAAVSELKSKGIYVNDFSVRCPDLPSDITPTTTVPGGFTEPCETNPCDDDPAGASNV